MVKKWWEDIRFARGGRFLKWTLYLASAQFSFSAAIDLSITHRRANCRRDSETALSSITLLIFLKTSCSVDSSAWGVDGGETIGVGPMPLSGRGASCALLRFAYSMLLWLRSAFQAVRQCCPTCYWETFKMRCLALERGNFVTGWEFLDSSSFCNYSTPSKNCRP